MQFFIDIDGTLCFNNRAFFFELCNTTFKLGISTDLFVGMTHADFLAQPEVAALRARLGEEVFAHKLGWLNFHPQAILAALPIPDAVEGLARLANLGPVSYYTARFSYNERRHAAIVSFTQQWLVDHQFLNSHRVTFCDGIQHKLLLLLQLTRDLDEDVVLVDDSYERLLAAIALIADKQASAAFLSRFTLIGVRAKELPAQATNVRLLALPHWRDIDTLIKHISYLKGEALPRL